MEAQLDATKQRGHRVAEPTRVPDVAVLSPLHPVLQLQQQAGNQAMQELLRSGVIRDRLAISNPDDPEEREADNVAHTIIGKHAGARCSCSPGEEMCEECQQKQPTPAIQRRASSPSTPSHVPRIVSDVLRSPGHPLDSATRTFFEPRFGRDFSYVRVHTDPEAAASARSIKAHAYTAGSHIAFASGQYSPDTAAGRSLLAHELTHIVQQSARLPQLQRQDNPDAGTTVSTTTAPGASARTEPLESPVKAPTEVTPRENAQRRIVFAAGVLQRVPQLTDPEEIRLTQIISSTTLYQLIQERQATWNKLEQRREQLDVVRPEHGVPEPGSPLATEIDILSDDINDLTAEVNRLDAEIQPQLAALGVNTIEELIRLVDEEFPTMFLKRAKQVADTMLNQNAEIARKELERYSEQVCSPDVEGLLVADRRLASINRDIEALQISIDMASRYAPSAGVPDEANLPPEAGSATYDIYHLAEHREQLALKQQEYRQVLAQQGVRFPILFASSYRAGMFAEATAEQLGQVVAQPVKDILDNIETVRKAIGDDLKVWTLRDVIEITAEDMGVEGNPVLMAAVQARIARQVRDDQFIATAKAALAFTTTILAGLVAGPLGAGLVGGIWGSFALVKDVREFRVESAAEHVAFDPVVADISINEPTLTWIVIDVATLGLDVSQVVGPLRGFARALTLTRDADSFTRFAAGARALLPGATADALIARAGRRFAQAAAMARVAEALLQRLPALRALGLDAQALERVLLKAPDLGQIKGQLLEELLGVRVRGMITGEAGRAALVGPRAARAAQQTVEFIPGHLITDMNGRQFTDGILALRQSDGTFRVLAVFESKAGRSAAKGLRSAYTSIEELSQPELEELKSYAIDELRGERSDLRRLSADDIARQYPADVDRMMRSLPRSEAGQVRRTLERLSPVVGQESTPVMINGNVTQLVGTPGTTRVIGVVPSDVNISRMTAAFQQEGISFRPMNLGLGQADLENLAQQLAQQAKNAL